LEKSMSASRTLRSPGALDLERNRANSLVGDDSSLIGGLISATTLVVLAYGISFLTYHSKVTN
jgi:hypothetical protein